MQTYIGPEALLLLLWSGVRLDGQRFREVSETAAATHLCLGVAALAGVARGFQLANELKLTPALMVVVGVGVALGGVVFESAIVFLLARIVPSCRAARFGEVLRPLALAAAPAVFYALVPLVPDTVPAGLVLSFWLILAFVVALRAALGCRMPLAIAVAILVRIVETAIDWGVQLL